MTLDTKENEESMRHGHFARSLLIPSLLLMLALPGCESCMERFIPLAPQDSGPPAYELGLVPAELRSTLRWPIPARALEEVDLTANTLEPAWTRSGVRLRVREQLQQLVIDADDVVVIAERDAYMNALVVRPGHRRIEVHGGTYGQLVIDPPTELHAPPPSWRAADMSEDVLIEGVEIHALDSGLSGALLRGRRIAMINSRVDARYHAVFLGDTAPTQSEDVVIAGCTLSSTGEEPTVVLSDVERAVIVDTWIENPLLSGLRVHGESEWVFASRNTLVGGGVMIGTDPRDDIEHAWLLANTIHHATPLLVSLEPDRIRELVLASNRIYSDSITCVWCGRTPESWVIGPNPIRAFRAPPARP